jgi:predicted transposase YbfD/YdcC
MRKGFGALQLGPREERAGRLLRQSVIRHFQSVEDPRIERTKRHNLMAVITIALLAVLSGADGFVAIETYGRAKQEWLCRFLDLSGGIPSHDTFARVFAAINPEEFESSFRSWVGTITERLGINVLNVDGKTSRGSYDREKGLKALHTVSAWSSEHQMVLAQQKVDGKSNEITAIPLLLKLLDLKGTVVTLDAMGTQTAIAREIKQAGGEYVLALKDNQGNLSKQVKGWFASAEAKEWSGIEYGYDKTVTAEHHRIETRQVWVVAVSQLPPLYRQELWTGLQSLVMLKSTRVLWNKTTTDVRCYISSLEADAQRHQQVIRSHWGIENSLHWVLDVTFNEDASRVRSGYAPQNLGLLRRLSVNLLKREPSKLSLKMKRYKAGMDNDFLLKILAASIPQADVENSVV